MINEKEMLRKTKKEMFDEMVKLDEELMAVTTENVALHSQVDKLQNEVATQNNTIFNLEQEIESLNNFKKDNEALSEMIERRDKENHDLKEVNDLKTTAYDDLNIDYHALKDKSFRIQITLSVCFLVILAMVLAIIALILS